MTRNGRGRVKRMQRVRMMNRTTILDQSMDLDLEAATTSKWRWAELQVAAEQGALLSDYRAGAGAGGVGAGAGLPAEPGGAEARAGGRDASALSPAMTSFALARIYFSSSSSATSSRDAYGRGAGRVNFIRGYQLDRSHCPHPLRRQFRHQHRRSRPFHPYAGSGFPFLEEWVGTSTTSTSTPSLSLTPALALAPTFMAIPPVSAGGNGGGEEDDGSGPPPTQYPFES
ncbi:hypothetical protein GALMADRAFT_212790 [Galerina marginata CBS 339.88]|uniref:Uncharacterized protein n=1 Tax=Galerina marginata (strain CBS 339.88) TaxID=685588 RepID=A0A067SR13_GALM3|nr:hypothetical protein GALMADRAFT_212790 [Galerina marginata CBS 339.88]